MRIQVDTAGISQLAQQLAQLSGKADAVMIEAITHVVNETHKEAVQGIQRGAKSGRVYRRGGVTHQASAPGQYPASDTGRLANSVERVFPSGRRMFGMVGTNLVYGRYLEFGTSRMAARPWLLPSFRKGVVDVERRLKRAIERLT